MKHVSFLIFLLLSVKIIVAQEVIVPSIDQLQGIWEFKEDDTRAYMIFNRNKSLLIINTISEAESNCYGKPYSYFGFWNAEAHGNLEPQSLSQLEKSGNVILFYDDLGEAYDSNGTLFKATRECFVTLNEGSDILNSEVLRFYYKGTPDVYTKIKQVPSVVLKTLKNKPKYWKIYTDFMGIVKKSL